MEFELEKTVNYRIVTAASLLKRSIYRIIAKNNLEITPEQWSLLYFLWKDDGLTVGELAEKSKKDFANATRIIEKLVTLGYAEKIRNVEDSRKINIHSTKKGKEIKEQIVVCLQESLEISVNGISKEEQSILVDLLLKIERNLLSVLSV